MLELIHEKTDGRLPTSTFTLRKEGDEVGYMQIRHKPSHGPDVPPECANHVDYQISKEHRRKGYGTQLLALGIEQARRIGLSDIVIICDADNEASRHIIEKNGGRFEGRFQSTTAGEAVLKYRIYLK